ncbi:RecT family recombinase [Thiomicrorhabdus aquaedulcis]|uniref:RecT family recombinase n=1 Tax=Thiomicrorhabdus aquaedulcis TaxID=2211106 RepID=UPI000FDABED0|nr:RecT family recombinase [Thiomicrorhabdus aquaedulcis]
MSNQVTVINQVLSNSKQDLVNLLPAHIKVENFMQICQTAAMVNPDLQTCTASSLAQAFIQCAKDGLVPDGKEAAIVIYNKKQGSNWVANAQYQPMIDGILKRLRQSGEVPYISAKVVYTEDQFDTGMDINGEYLSFKPNYNSKNRTNNDIKLVFAMAKLKNGEAIIEVMTLEDVQRIMMLSKSAIDTKTGKLNEWSVWGKFFDRMALKTVLHRLAKRLPNSSEVMEMLEREIQVREIKNGRFEEITPVQTAPSVSVEKIEELKKMVASSRSNEAQMFAFISSVSQRTVNSYQDLDAVQYENLVSMIEKKIQKNVQQQREADMQGNVLNGEFVQATA